MKLFSMTCLFKNKNVSNIPIIIELMLYVAKLHWHLIPDLLTNLLSYSEGPTFRDLSCGFWKIFLFNVTIKMRLVRNQHPPIEIIFFFNNLL